MLTFRQKVIVIYVVIFLFFLAVLFPFTREVVRKIVQHQLAWRAKELISEINTERNISDVIEQLYSHKDLLFARVSLIDSEGRILYDSHVEDILGSTFQKGYLTNHPEVTEALKKNIGYAEGYSRILKKSFVYVAKSFTFHGQKFIMRTAFPYNYIAQMIEDFQLGFLTFGGVVLILFTMISWFAINQLSRPINQIINAIRPFQDGKTKHIPKISLSKSISNKDDFAKLATTLNSLSERIQQQIDILTYERNEKTAILETLVEGVLAIDDQERVIFVNNTASNLLKIKEQELLACSLSTHDTDLCRHCYLLLNQCIRDQRYVYSEAFPDKNHRFLDLVAVPKKQGAILVIQDQTNHYRLLEMRRAFIANASHELKTPITIVKGFAETLKDNPELPDTTVFAIITRIVNNCDRMSNLIQNLLTLSDLENIPDSRLQKCDFRDIIDHCQQMVSKIYPTAKITISQEGPSKFFGEINLLELAIKNLLENAAKYSKEPAEITVNLASADDIMTITISDNGIGIPEDDLQHIFQRFYTVDKARTRKLGGAGLGLSIVQTIIEKHQGHISADSILGEGTTFMIKLPIRTLIQRKNEE